MEPIYDAFTNEQLKIGDELRSIERGDTVRVFELGERWCGTADPVPTIWLEPLRTTPPKAFEGRLSDHNGKHCLIAYTKVPPLKQSSKLTGGLHHLRNKPRPLRRNVECLA